MPTATELSVRVIPNASQNLIVGWHLGSLKVKTTAAPESGKANKAVCVLIARELGVPRRSVSVLRGHANPHKCLRIEGLAEAELQDRLGSSRS